MIKESTPSTSEKFFGGSEKPGFIANYRNANSVSRPLNTSVSFFPRTASVCRRRKSRRSQTGQYHAKSKIYSLFSASAISIGDLFGTIQISLFRLRV